MALLRVKWATRDSKETKLSYCTEKAYKKTEDASGAKSGALEDLPTELQILIKAWADLQDASKVRIMAILLEESNSNVDPI